MSEELPADVREAVVSLARKERGADRPDRVERLAARRERLLEEFGYTSRIREDEAGTTLVCYPRAWMDDGTVQLDEIEDLSAAVELTFEGAGDPDEWAAIDARNRAIVERVREEHGDTHGANARAFAAFMSNHRAREIGTATQADIEEFLTEYYVRNAWPTDTEAAMVEESIELVQAAADRADYT